MNCKNCKYYYTTTQDRLQGSVIVSDSVGRCSNHLLSVDGLIGCPDNGILATCDEDRGELEVGENFGCIHFENKQ